MVRPVRCRAPRPVRALPLALLLLSLGPLASPAAAQWPPDSLVNLQVLPEDIGVRELTRLMAGFTRALGVRCSDCHLGEESQPLAAYDFASDDKELKRKARRRVDILFAAPVDPAEFVAAEGVRAAAATGGGHGVRLEVDGPLDAVFRVAARHDVRDFTSREADLEEVFLAYYGGDAS